MRDNRTIIYGLIGGIAVLLVVSIVLAVVLLSGGGDDDKGNGDPQEAAAPTETTSANGGNAPAVTASPAMPMVDIQTEAPTEVIMASGVTEAPTVVVITASVEAVPLVVTEAAPVAPSETPTVPSPTPIPPTPVPPTPIPPTPVPPTPIPPTPIPPTPVPAVVEPTILYPAGHRVEMFYDAVSFYLRNASSEPIAVASLQFEGLNAAGNPTGRVFNGARWQQVSRYGYVDQGACNALEMGNSQPWLRPSPCTRRNAIVNPTPNDTQVFWREYDGAVQFRVLWDGQEVGRCGIVLDTVGGCEVYLP